MRVGNRGAETDPLAPLAAAAAVGDREATERLLAAIRDAVYNLALRMLWSSEDAQDATQDILLKVLTHLAGFRGESAVTTWVYRVAANHLLNVRRSRIEQRELTFAAFGDALATGLADPPARAADHPEQALLEEEVKIGCTQAMLLCLDREQRIAYILGEVFELPGAEASAVLGIAPAAYRKRLSRARERLRAFMSVHCGLVDEAAPCRCARRIETALATGIVDPRHLRFAGRGKPLGRPLPVAAQVAEMEELHRIAGIYRSHPRYTAPETMGEAVRQLMQAKAPSLLAPPEE